MYQIPQKQVPRRIEKGNKGEITHWQRNHSEIKESDQSFGLFRGDHDRNLSPCLAIIEARPCIGGKNSVNPVRPRLQSSLTTINNHGTIGNARNRHGLKTFTHDFPRGDVSFARTGSLNGWLPIYSMTYSHRSNGGDDQMALIQPCDFSVSVRRIRLRIRVKCERAELLKSGRFDLTI